MSASNTRAYKFFGKGSVYVSPPAASNESGIRRLDINKDALLTQPASGVYTVPDVIDYAARTYRERDAMGWRDVIDILEEEKEVKKTVDGKEQVEKKKWKYFQLSEYKFINFIQLKEAVSEVARAFVDLGITSEEVLDIFAETSINWQIISHACALISTTTATAYDTLGEAGLTHSLNEPKCVAIYTNTELFPVLVKVLVNTPTVRFVFFDGSPSADTLEQLKSIRRGEDNTVQVYSIDALRELGRSKPLDTLSDRRPAPDTLACIMYTSGSTGNPKGVCLTHGNLVSAVAAMSRVFEPHIQTGNRFMAYLPLAHVLEYAVELCALFQGVTCGYGRAKTLTDQSVRKCRGDLAAFKPTIMFGVPAVWEMMRKGVMSKVEKSGWVAKSMFGAALEAKRWTGSWVPGLNWALDYLVLNKVKDVLGGQLHFIVNGGAAISRETQEFFNLAVAPLSQGYGLTESCGMCAFLPLEMLSENTFGTVGLPAPSIEIKFLDCPDMGYTSSTSADQEGSSSSSSDRKNHLPQGEICIRGASVTKGYFNRPDLNNDESIFTKDGWLRTGDVGQWNEDGTLTLIDRLKNLVKMQNGEYIAIERLESTYKSSSFVANLCVYAPQNAQQPIAIVVPNEDNLRQALCRNANQKAPAPSPLDPKVNPNGVNSDPASQPSTSSLAHQDIVHLCNDPSVRALVLNELNGLAKKNKFVRAEMLAAVLLSPEEWTSKNGMVTAAQKLNRHKIIEKFKGDVEEVFKRQ